MEDFGKFCLAILLVIIASVFSGYVFMELWDWFVVPVFGFKNLLLIQAVGLSFFIGFLKHKYKKKDKEKDDDSFTDILKIFADNLLHSAVSLGIGWILTLFL